MLYFSFMQGIIAFLAPCAIALLPGYIAHFLSQSDTNTKVSALKQGLKLAGGAIVGILLVYAIAGVLIVVASELLKTYMKWIVIIMGIFLIVLGIAQLFGKQLSVNLHIQHKHKHPIAESFFFGVSYALGALGCLFPLFLVVVTQALSAESMVVGISYIVAYFLGLCLMMLLVIVGTMYSKKMIQRYIRSVLPYMNNFTAIILILAGIYIIRYQLILF